MKNKCLFCKKHLHFEEKEYIMRKYITLSGQSDKEKYKTNKKQEDEEMKKIISLLLALTMTVSLVACSSASAPAEEAPAATEEAATEEAPAEA